MTHDRGLMASKGANKVIVSLRGKDRIAEPAELSYYKVPTDILHLYLVVAVPPAA